MFSKSLDSKGSYNKNNFILKDLTESIFKNLKLDLNVIYSYYKVSRDLEMRPDKISNSLYGSDNYAEIVMKHSGIDNPFAIEEGDILVVPSLTSIYNNIKDLTEYETDSSDRPTSAYELIQNYHKYIDKSKVPVKNGSDNNNVNIEKNNDNGGFSADIFNGLTQFDSDGNQISTSSGISTSGSSTSSSSAAGIQSGEANLANKGQSGIYLKNGRIYFGKNVSTSAENGVDIEGSNNINNDLVDCAKDGTTLGQFLNSIIKI